MHGFSDLLICERSFQLFIDISIHIRGIKKLKKKPFTKTEIGYWPQNLLLYIFFSFYFLGSRVGPNLDYLMMASPASNTVYD